MSKKHRMDHQREQAMEDREREALARPAEPTLIFMDTEFTSLGEKGQPQLISIGMCLAKGGEEFYKEVDFFKLELTSQFTKDKVIPLLWRGGYKTPFEKLAIQVKEWIEARGPDVILALDSPWDWAWMRSIGAGSQTLRVDLPDACSQLPLWPKNLREQWFYLSFNDLPMQERTISQIAWSEHCQRFTAHHALMDARGNRAVTQAVMREAMVTSFEELCEVFRGPEGQCALVSANPEPQRRGGPPDKA